LLTLQSFSGGGESMNNEEVERVVETLEKIGKVLGALYASHLGDMEQGVKVERLSRCGFSNIEIAALLGTTPNTVNVALHKVRKGKSKKSK
jgi:DNA-binding NarL/FixJ family response regulator